MLFNTILLPFGSGCRRVRTTNEHRYVDGRNRHGNNIFNIIYFSRAFKTSADTNDEPCDSGFSFNEADGTCSGMKH